MLAASTAAVAFLDEVDEEGSPENDDADDAVPRIPPRVPTASSVVSGGAVAAEAATLFATDATAEEIAAAFPELPAGTGGRSVTPTIPTDTAVPTRARA
jgi:hypothetical protein